MHENKDLASGPQPERAFDRTSTGPDLSPILGELLARRVPRILGAFLAASWLVLEVTDWVVNRYVLSAHVKDCVVACWLLLLPSVLLLAWFHGRPGRDHRPRGDAVRQAASACAMES